MVFTWKQFTCKFWKPLFTIIIMKLRKWITYGQNKCIFITLTFLIFDSLIINIDIENPCPTWPINFKCDNEWIEKDMINSCYNKWTLVKTFKAMDSNICVRTVKNYVGNECDDDLPNMSDAKDEGLFNSETGTRSVLPQNESSHWWHLKLNCIRETQLLTYCWRESKKRIFHSFPFFFSFFSIISRS